MVVLLLVVHHYVVVLVVGLSVGALALLVPNDWHVRYIANIFLRVQSIKLLVLGVEHVVVTAVKGAALVVKPLLSLLSLVRNVLVFVVIIIILLVVQVRLAQLVLDNLGVALLALHLVLQRGCHPLRRRTLVGRGIGSPRRHSKALPGLLDGRQVDAAVLLLLAVHVDRVLDALLVVVVLVLAVDGLALLSLREVVVHGVVGVQAV